MTNYELIKLVGEHCTAKTIRICSTTEPMSKQRISQLDRLEKNPQQIQLTRMYRAVYDAYYDIKPSK